MPQLPHPREPAVDQKAVANIVRRVQWERLQELDPWKMDGKELLPYAHKNVIALADEIDQHTEYNPRIVLGQLINDEQTDDEIEAHLRSYSVKDVEHKGHVHFWVEIPREDREPLVCDIATKSETGLTRGSMLCRPGRPPEYRAPPDSVFEYDPDMEPADLRSHDHYGSFIEKYDPVE